MFLAIAILVLMDAVALHIARAAADSFDATVRAAVHSAASPRLTTFFRLATWLGSTAVLIPLSVIAALALNHTRAKLLTLLAFAGAYTLTEVTKAIVQRPRPVPFFIASPETWSFPSGHSLESAAVYWTIAAILVSQAPTHARRTVVSSLAILPFIVGISRIYLGVHYPTDVLAGWAAGSCWSVGVVAALHTGNSGAPFHVG